MKNKNKDFISLYKQMYQDNPWKMAPFAFWKMKELFEEATVHFHEETRAYMPVRDNHLVTIMAENTPTIENVDYNSLDCITIREDQFSLIKDELKGFNKAEIEPLYYNFTTKLESTLSNDYSVVEFDFNNIEHYQKAAEIINEDLGRFFSDRNIKKMTSFYTFDPKLWFFIRDKKEDELIGISVSTFEQDVKEVDIDWMYIRTRYHKKGIGRFMIEETVRRSKGAKIIRVSGKNEFYKKCGFAPRGIWVWLAKPDYSLYAPAIQPNITE